MAFFQNARHLIALVPTSNLLLGILVIVFLGLQFRLWSYDGGFLELKNTSDDIFEQKDLIKSLAMRNQRMREEIMDLNRSLNAIEERARMELGLVKDGEVFYMIINE